VKKINTGNIYCITNKINGKKYIGQTIRAVEVRFNEHCYDHRSTSKIHKAIQKYGVINFEVSVLETPLRENLDEREQFWIKELDTVNNGYNILYGGNCIGNDSNTHGVILVVERNLTFHSAEEMGRQMSELTLWSSKFLIKKIRECCNNGKLFYGYHLSLIDKGNDISPIDEQEEWIKNLSVTYCGKHIYCPELNMEFETIAAAAKYLLDNDLYTTTSKTPIQSLVTSIGRVINGKAMNIEGNILYTFQQIPGYTKQLGASNPFQNQKIYCPQLDKIWNSQVEAAEYFINNQIWRGIKLKTAKLRISDIVRGAFPDYRGYTFQKIED